MPEAGKKSFPASPPEFPYIASRAELDYFTEKSAPWHWHKSVELFYMESGRLDYCTPSGAVSFPAGWGGMVNSNVLHTTRISSSPEKTVQLLHIFDPSLLAGEYGSRIGQKYIMPLTAAARPEIIPLSPGDPGQARVLGMIRQAFSLSEDEFGYEIKLRELLSGIWLRLLELSPPCAREKECPGAGAKDKIKSMMIYVHEHYAERITVSGLAAAAFLSERECYRVFRECLHMTPAQYIKSCRLQAARQMLVNGREPVTVISQSCGLGSSSYFGRLFREQTGCSPTEYRQKHRDAAAGQSRARNGG